MRPVALRSGPEAVRHEFDAKAAPKDMEETYLPAFEALADAMEDLKGTGTNDAGICNYEGGKDYYENYIFPKYSGSARSVDSAIQLMDTRRQNLMIKEGEDWRNFVIAYILVYQLIYI